MQRETEKIKEEKRLTFTVKLLSSPPPPLLEILPSAFGRCCGDVFKRQFSEEECKYRVPRVGVSFIDISASCCL